MPTRQDLTGQVGNVEVMELEVTKEDGSALELTGRELEFYVKQYASDSDLDAIIALTRLDDDMVIISESEGKLEVQFSIMVHWRYWWRLDVISNDAPSTALYGFLKMEAT